MIIILQIRNSCHIIVYFRTIWGHVKHAFATTESETKKAKLCKGRRWQKSISLEGMVKT